MLYDSPKNVRILFIGTPKIAVKPLLRLLELGYNVVGVVSNEDKEVGRKHLLAFPPVKEAALLHDIPVYQPHRIRSDHSWAKDLNLDLIVTMAYGQILPDDLLALPKKGSLNLHGSLLPKYRGAAPIQRAIESGEKETGITLMEMVKEMDAGRMYAKEVVSIEENDTYTSLSEKLSEAAASILEKHLLLYLNDELPGETQNENEVTFADKISPEEEKLSLEMEKTPLIRKIHALSEEPGGYLFIEGKKLKIFDATSFDTAENEEIGSLSIRQKKLIFQAKGGHVALLNVQLEGKKRMSGLDFSSGLHLKGDERLS